MCNMKLVLKNILLKMQFLIGIMLTLYFQENVMQLQYKNDNNNKNEEK